MLPERLYVRFNAADSMARYHQAEEAFPFDIVDREQLQRVLACQAGRLLVLHGYPSLDSAEALPLSIDHSKIPTQLRIYNRNSLRDPQTNRPIDAGQFVVSDSPPPEITIHQDIHFWLDQVIAADQ